MRLAVALLMLSLLAAQTGGVHFFRESWDALLHEA